MMLDNMSRLHRYQTISISPENLTGEKGKGGAMPVEEGSSYEAARELGTGWKVNPRMFIPAGETLTLSITFDEEVPENTSGSASTMPGQVP